MEQNVIACVAIFVMGWLLGRVDSALARFICELLDNATIELKLKTGTISIDEARKILHDRGGRTPS